MTRSYSFIELYFLIFIALLSATSANAESYQSGHNEKLLADLFKTYDKRIRPNANANKPVQVSETILGSILIQVEENKQIASYVVVRRQNYSDPRFTWDPQKYGGIEFILVPTCDVWRSDIFNFNLEEFENLLPEQADYAKIYYNGQVFITMPQYVETTCKIMVYRFPFDTQFCTLSLSSNQMDSTLLEFAPLPVYYKPTNFFGNSEWTIENASMVALIKEDDGVWGEKGYVFHYVFQIKRCPTYYITVIVVPTFLITAVSIVGIFAPGTDHEPGDVANLGLGTLLALMVLLGIISDKLPKSQEMPLLGFHILVILMVFCLCILLEMASLYKFQKWMQSGKHPPRWLWRATLFGIFPGKHLDNTSFKRRLSLKSSKTVSSLDTDSIRNMENGLIENGNVTKEKAKKNGLVKRVKSKDPTDFNRWKLIIKEFKTKVEERQEDIKKEWDLIETRLDFIWITVFESFNIMNLLSLIYFANLPTPPMKDWLE